MSEHPNPSDLSREMGLAELVNRVLDRGAVITGEVTIGVAGIDLIYLGIQLVLSSAETAQSRGVYKLNPGDE
jgi:gas vesicle structural protein